MQPSVSRYPAAKSIGEICGRRGNRYFAAPGPIKARKNWMKITNNVDDKIVKLRISAIVQLENRAVFFFNKLGLK